MKQKYKFDVFVFGKDLHVRMTRDCENGGACMLLSAAVAAGSKYIASAYEMDEFHKYTQSHFSILLKEQCELFNVIPRYVDFLNLMAYGIFIQFHLGFLVHILSHTFDLNFRLARWMG
jgi:hypothetical protein